MRRATPRKTLAVALAASVGLMLAGMAGVWAAQAVVPKIPASVRAAFEQPPRAKACFDIDHADARPEAWCAINAGRQAKPTFALLGDSHALQVLDAFEAAARGAGRTGVFTGYSGCPPFLGIVPLTRPDQDRLDCGALNRRTVAYVKERGIRDVFLVAKWSYYTDRWNGSLYVNAIGQRPGEPVSLENSRRAFEAGFAATLQTYAAMGVRVHVLEQVPQQLFDPRAIYDRALLAGLPAKQVLEEASVPLVRHRALQAFPAAVFRRPDLPARDVLNMDDLFCDQQRCTVGTPSQPYYTDISHLSAAGARRLVPRLQRALAGKP